MSVAYVPLVSLRDGHLDGASADASVAQIQILSRSHELIYVYDRDGIEAGAPSHEFYQRLERAHVHPWIDPGCRTPEDAIDAFFAGAEVLTVRPQLMPAKNLRELADMAEGEIHLCFRVEGNYAKAGERAHDLLRWAEETRARGVVLEPHGAAEATTLATLADEVRRRDLEASLLLVDPDPAFERALDRERFHRIITDPRRIPTA